MTAETSIIKTTLNRVRLANIVIAVSMCGTGILFILYVANFQNSSDYESELRTLATAWRAAARNCVDDYDALRQQLNVCADGLEECRAEEPEEVIKETARFYGPEFLNVAYGVAASHEYTPDSYNCEWFSEQLGARLEAAGYDAKPKQVTVDCSSGVLEDGSCSRWAGRHVIMEVTLYIESETGVLITPEKYKDYGIK